jgi:hypothetical protein
MGSIKTWNTCLGVLFLTLELLDIWTTEIGLRLSHVELNPIAAHASAMGMLYLFEMLKMAVALTIVSVFFRIGGKRAVVGLSILDAAMLFVVINNIGKVLHG